MPETSFGALPEPEMEPERSPIPEPLDDPLLEQSSDFSTTLAEPFSSSPYSHSVPQPTDYVQQSFSQPQYQQPVRHEAQQQYSPPDAYAPHDAYTAPQPGGPTSPDALFDSRGLQSASVLQPPQHVPHTAPSDAWGPPDAAAGSGAAQPFGGSIGAATWAAPPVAVPATGGAGGVGTRPGAGRGPSAQGRLFQAYNKRRPGAVPHGGLSSSAGAAHVEAPLEAIPTAQPPPAHVHPAGQIPGHDLDHPVPPQAGPGFDPLPHVQQVAPAAAEAYAPPAQSTLSAASASFRPQAAALWGYGDGEAAPPPAAVTAPPPLGVGPGSTVYGAPAPGSAGAAPPYGMAAPSYTAQAMNLPDTLIDTPSTMAGQVPSHPPPHPPPPVQHPGMAPGYYGVPNGQLGGDNGYYSGYGYSSVRLYFLGSLIFTAFCARAVCWRGSSSMRHAALNGGSMRAGASRLRSEAGRLRDAGARAAPAAGPARAAHAGVVPLGPPRHVHACGLGSPALLDVPRPSRHACGACQRVPAHCGCCLGRPALVSTMRPSCLGPSCHRSVHVLCCAGRSEVNMHPMHAC